MLPKALGTCKAGLERQGEQGSGVNKVEWILKGEHGNMITK